MLGRAFYHPRSDIVSGTIIARRAYVVAYRFQPGVANGAELFVNGASQGTADTSAVTAGTRLASIGSHPRGGAYFDGDLAELLVFSAALSDNEIQQIEQYLAAKYMMKK